MYKKFKKIEQVDICKLKMKEKQENTHEINIKSVIKGAKCQARIAQNELKGRKYFIIQKKIFNNTKNLTRRILNTFQTITYHTKIKIKLFRYQGSDDDKS